MLAPKIIAKIINAQHLAALAYENARRHTPSHPLMATHHQLQGAKWSALARALADIEDGPTAEPEYF